MSELDDLRAAVALLAARVQTLEDEHAIRQLVAQYGPAVDSGSGEAAAALWTAAHREMLALSPVKTATNKAKLGLIGAGRMGRPMVDRLVAAGHDLTVLARTPEARAVHDIARLRSADTIAASVRDAEVVFVAVFSDEQARSVCLGPDGALACMNEGSTLILHTTCDPATAELLAEVGARRGIHVLDAPFSGGPHDIAAGTVTLWVGGERAVFDTLRPLLATFAGEVLWVGPIGHGQRVKLVNNALFVAQAGLVIDAVRLARELGIAEPTLLASLRHGSADSRALHVVGRGGSVHDAAARLSTFMQKDVDSVRRAAASARADLGLLGAVLSSETVDKSILHPAPSPSSSSPPPR